MIKLFVKRKFYKMKATITLAMALLISTSVMAALNYQNSKNEKLVATYDGVTEDGQYKFTNEKKEVFLFDDVGDDVDIDLYEENYVGKTFSITWEGEKFDLLDDQGDSTGETEVVRTILTIKQKG